MINWLELLKLLKEYGAYIHWGKLFGFTLLGALLGFVIGVALVVFTKRFIGVDRQNKWWNLVKYFWYISIPLWIGFSGLKYGLFHSLQKNMETIVPEVIHEATGALHLADNEWIHAALVDGGYSYEGTQGKQLLKLTPNNAIDIGVGIAMDYYTNTMDSIATSDITIARKTAIVLKGIIGIKAVSYLLKKTLKSQLEKTLKIDQDISEEMLSTSFEEFLKDGFIVKFTSAIVHDIFKSIKNSILLLCFLVLLLPLAEIVAAHVIVNKQNNEGL